MENKRSYLVSFGDSSKYRIYFEGSKDDFEHSEALSVIKAKVGDFLKEKFPTGGYEDTVRIDVADDDGRNYQLLDEAGLDDIFKSVERQVDVMRDGKELNNNAPYDQD